MLNVSQKTKRARKPKVGRKRSKEHDHWVGLYYVLGTLALMIFPIIGYFFYNVWKDPLTPKLAAEIFEVVKKRTLSYVGKKTNEQKAD
eukprot:gene47161-57761_t